MRTYATSPTLDPFERGSAIVLHVIEAFGGGVETALRSYINNSPGFQHVVVCRQRPGHSTGIFQNHEIEFIEAKGNLLQLRAQLVRQIARLRPDVVHAHSSFAGLIARTIVRADCGIVYSPHCYATERTDVGAWRRRAFALFEQTAGRRPHVVAALSPHEAELAIRLNPGCVVVVVPNAVDAAPMPARRHLKSQTAGPVRAVAVGRISKQKDPEFLVAGLMASNYRRQLEVTWVGDGDASSRLELERVGVEVLGWMPNNLVQAQMAQSDLFLHTAAWEGSPMTLLEAAALGVPILARTIPALRGLGYYQAGDTPGAFAGHLDRFICDDSFRDVLRKWTAEVASRHTSQEQAEALVDCYAAAMALRNRSTWQEGRR